MRQFQNPLNVGVGDEVEFFFGFQDEPAKRNRSGRVTELKPGYGRLNKFSGGHRKGGSVTFVNSQTGQEETVALSYATKITGRNPLPPRTVNIFQRGGRVDIARLPNGKVGGFLENMVQYYLAVLPYRLDRPLNLERVRELFEQQRPGWCNEPWPHVSYIIVTEKVFKAWVGRNALRFLATVAELDKEETAYEKTWESHYEGWIEYDLSVGANL